MQLISRKKSDFEYFAGLIITGYKREIRSRHGVVDVQLAM